MTKGICIQSESVFTIKKTCWFMPSSEIFTTVCQFHSLGGCTLLFDNKANVHTVRSKPTNRQLITQRPRLGGFFGRGCEPPPTSYWVWGAL